MHESYLREKEAIKKQDAQRKTTLTGLALLLLVCVVGGIAGGMTKRSQRLVDEDEAVVLPEHSESCQVEVTGLHSAKTNCPKDCSSRKAVMDEYLACQTGCTKGGNAAVTSGCTEITNQRVCADRVKHGACDAACKKYLFGKNHPICTSACENRAATSCENAIAILETIRNPASSEL